MNYDSITQHFAERAEYNWTAELSVYTELKAKGHGVGCQLYEKMIKLSSLQGIQTVYAIVFQNNVASEKLHEKLDFRLAGVFRNVGYKMVCGYHVPTMKKRLALMM